MLDSYSSLFQRHVAFSFDKQLQLAELIDQFNWCALCLIPALFQTINDAHLTPQVKDKCHTRGRCGVVAACGTAHLFKLYLAT
jgi:hypothetical protein